MPLFDQKSAQKIRLQVFLSRNGVCSRRAAFDLIKQGRVAVNGQTVQEPSLAVTGQDDIWVDGHKIGVKSFEYILLNKPAGYVTTKEDRFADRTVLDLLPKDLQHLHPVGRLDKDTEGLLLFTNDGDLTQRLTHPSQGVDKVYFVKVGGQVSAAAQKKIEAGVMIDGQKTAPAKIRDLKFVGQETEFLLTIHEGRKRQIRFMMQGLGYGVIYLKRVKQGTLALGNLKLGAWRRLTTEEVQDLKVQIPNSK